MKRQQGSQRTSSVTMYMARLLFWKS